MIDTPFGVEIYGANAVEVYGGVASFMSAEDALDFVNERSNPVSYRVVYPYRKAAPCMIRNVATGRTVARFEHFVDSITYFNEGIERDSDYQNEFQLIYYPGR